MAEHRRRRSPVRPPQERLYAKEAAALLEIEVDTWWSYVTRARHRLEAGDARPTDAPQPDGWDRRRAWWYRSTVEDWQRMRPGEGIRTDLWSPEWRPVPE